MTRRVSKSASDKDTFVLPYRWKVGELVDLPERELRSWHDNMEAGIDLAHDELALTYKVGNSLFTFHLGPRKLYTPEGKEHFIEPDESAVQESESPGAGERIARFLVSKIKDPEVPMAHRIEVNPDKIDYTGTSAAEENIPRTLPMITYGELVTDLIQSQFTALEERGVERAGYFTSGLKGLKHMPAPMKDHIVFTDINRYNVLDDGSFLPYMVIKADIDKIKLGDVHSLYHTHWAGDDNKPSWFDLEALSCQGEHNIIIASRQAPKDEAGAYLVSDWKPRTGVDLPGELKKCRAPDTSLERYDRRKIAALIGTRLEKQDYLLHEVDGRMRLDKVEVMDNPPK